MREQWRELVFSPKRAYLTYARIVEAHLVSAWTLAHATSLHFERRIISLRREGLA